jgi:general secretion pathway protein D
VIRSPCRARLSAATLAATLLVAAIFGAGPAAAQRGAAPSAPAGGELVQLDFNNAELSVVIDTIAKLTGKNFIYDDRVRGRVTVVSPTRITVDEAYAVFESVLQVKGFTTVPTPGGALKVIPVRDAKETSVPTDLSARPPLNRDLYITRLIPLQYIDAESIVNTLKPLVSKDAAMAAYQPTNTVILTESASNIRRLISIIEAIDVDTYREDLAVIHLDYADAATMAQQLSDIYGAEVAGGALPTATRSRRATQAAPQAPPTGQSPLKNVRIITDERTNSLIVLAARAQLEEVRTLARKLDVPVSGGGRVHVYYLQHADAEELAQTLNSLISGAPASAVGGGGAAGGAGQAQALRAVVAGLAEGVTVTADPPTNALVIQASQEGYSSLAAVIEKLDIERPQVLVEALIMEVDVTDSKELGFDGLYRLITSHTDIIVASHTGGQAFGSAIGGAFPGANEVIPALLGRGITDTRDDDDGDGTPDGSGTVIQGIIRAAASDNNANIISAPHILTSDNEEAEIRVGDNIPIISSRVQSAQGITTPDVPNSSLATSVNVERQDIGVTLRVTPQITEGETLRLDIFQEITAVNSGLTVTTTLASGQSGVALSSRKVENTVVVADGETVVIGGILTDDYSDNVSKVPWLGDIPFLGWAFKSVERTLTKKNLLVFLTPHIIRTKEDLELETIRKREEFRISTGEQLGMEEETRTLELERRREALLQGTSIASPSSKDPALNRLLDHEARYPLERMQQIEEQQLLERRAKEGSARRASAGYMIQAAVLGDEKTAMETLVRLVDAGYDGTIVSADTTGAVLYEIRVGPYDNLADAQRAGEAIRRSEGLTPALLVEPPAPEEP